MSDIDDCADAPCENDATCSDQVNEYVYFKYINLLPSIAYQSRIMIIVLDKNYKYIFLNILALHVFVQMDFLEHYVMRVSLFHLESQLKKIISHLHQQLHETINNASFLYS